jgi:gas vesicle protein
MSRAGKFMLGALVGALFAAALVILLTPSSGSELKDKFKARLGTIQAEMAKAAEQRRTQMQAELEALRQPRK